LDGLPVCGINGGVWIVNSVRCQSHS
jgi:hypothetical protein